VGATVAAFVGGHVLLRGQSAPAPILVITNSAAPNRFGSYFAEILRAEGLNEFTTADLGTVDVTVLASAPLVVLAETPLTPSQASLFSNYVAGGGRLVAIRPDPQLANVLGIIPQGSSLTNGYLSIEQSNPVGAGLTATTLPLKGSADRYTLVGGAATVATLYSNQTTATTFPAVVRYGRTATWAFDLARSVAYTRQGDPAFAGLDRDGLAPLRTNDVFFNTIDKDRVNLPHADIQMRLFSRMITDLLADAMPLPRLWYFPGTVRTLVVLTLDSHANPQSWFDQEIASIEARGGRASIYIFNGSSPSPASVATWRARGHEVGMHPAAFQNGWTLDQAYLANQNYFTNGGYGTPSTTTRNHQIEWQGWVDAAKVARNYGIGLDTSFYTWGPSVTYTDGHQAHGYINGSGLPMRFIDQSGVIVPVYQQVTSIIDEQLLVSDYSEHLSTAQALAVSHQLIDDSQAGGYSAITTQFHVDYFAFGQVQPWAEGTMDYANSLGLPMWPAERWLNYTTARAATTISDVVWVSGSKQLRFTASVPSGGPAQSLTVPSSYGGAALTGVTVNGAAVAATSQSINGRAYSFFVVAPVSGGAAVVATYGNAPPDTTPPVISNLTVQSLLSTSAVITWTTDEAATSQVFYGVGSPTSSTTLDPTLVLNHVVTLNGLVPNTPYVYRASSQDAANNPATSGIQTFTTPQQTPALTISDATVTEGAGPAVFTVTLSPTSSQAVTVNYGTSNGTAVAPTDYTTTGGTLTIPAGMTSGTISVPIVTDALDEANETFTVNLSNPINATVADGTSIGTIVDDDPAPSLSIDDVSIAEGNSGAITAVFTVTLSAVSGQTVTVNYATVNGTAAAPGDFIATSNTLTIPAGAPSGTISVSIVPDAVTEPNETFNVALTSPTNATLAKATGVGTIVNDDTGAGPVTVTFQVAAGGDDVNENGTTFSDTASSIWFGNASGASYTGLRFTNVLLPPGATVTSAHLEVNAANTQWIGMAFEFGMEAAANSQPFTSTSKPSQRALLTPRVAHSSDQQWVSGTWYSLDELAPLVQAALNQPGWASGNALSLLLRGTGQAWARKFGRAFEGGATFAPRLVVTYAPGGPVPPSLSVNDVSILEGSGGTTTAVFNVTLSAASSQAVTVDYSTGNGTAVAPGDYTTSGGTLTIPASTMSATIQVPIVSDTTPEPTETFSLVLSSPTNATIAKGTGVGTILDDDTPTLTVSDATVTEGAGPAVFTVTLSPASSLPVTVTFATTNGSATAPADYTAISSTPLTIQAGMTTGTISVPIAADTLDEPSETFTVTLSNPINATITDGTGLGTIVDDDSPPSLSISDVSIAEGTGGTTTAVFTVTLSAASGQTVTVNYATANGTAGAPGDYTATSGTLTIAAGSTTGTIPVSILPDAITEPNETFTVTLTAPTNATLLKASGQGTIINDDTGTGPVTVTFQVAAGSDDVNENGTTFDDTSSAIWFGNASSATGSYTGLRFTNVLIPPGATITSAHLEVNAAATQWISMAFEFGIEAATNSQTFTSTSKPSQRTLLAPRVAHSSNQQWVASTWYSLDELAPVVQAAVNQAGWASGNALALVLRGTGQAWARKFGRSFEGGSTLAPRLVITFTAP
jgi:hypothetical protein